jgi:hypothetical protein
VVLDKDTLKMTNGSSLLLAEDTDDKNDKSQSTAFLCFYLLGLMQRETLVRFARVLPFDIYNVF